MRNDEKWISLEVGHHIRIKATCIVKMIKQTYTKQLGFNGVNGIAATQSAWNEYGVNDLKCDATNVCEMRVLTIPVSDITQYPILSPYFIPVVVGKKMIWLCMKLGYTNIWCLIMILLHPYDNGRNWGPAISHGYPNWHPLGRCFIVRIFLLESPGNWPWKENGDSWRAKNRRVDVCRPELRTWEKSLGNIFIDIYIYI